jgi:hypothetical protein
MPALSNAGPPSGAAHRGALSGWRGAAQAQQLSPARRLGILIHNAAGRHKPARGPIKSYEGLRTPGNPGSG